MLGAVRVSQESLDTIIDRVGAKYAVDPNLVRGIIKTESNWDVNTSRYEAHKGDASWGLMQVLLATARWMLNDNSLDTTRLIRPEVNIEAGTKYLSWLMGRYKNLNDVIAAYNAGTPKKDKDGKYVNQKYVDSVLSNYNFYRGLSAVSNPISLAAIAAGVGAIVFLSRR